MASTVIPGWGQVWQCESCLTGLHSEGGHTYKWNRPVTKIERRDRKEKRSMSSKPCPECKNPMWEIVMPDFGSRWQCEHCRLTVFTSGGIQRWSAPKK
jgi:ribosomal protein S27AE